MPLIHRHRVGHGTERDIHQSIIFGGDIRANIFHHPGAHRALATGGVSRNEKDCRHPGARVPTLTRRAAASGWSTLLIVGAGGAPVVSYMYSCAFRVSGWMGRLAWDDAAEDGRPPSIGPAGEGATDGLITLTSPPWLTWYSLLD